MKKIYVTITVMNFDSGGKLIYDGDFNPNMIPFEVGEIIKLKKEHSQSENLEAIEATVPFNGKIGYVANNNNRKIKGTLSAERIYDMIKDIAYAKIIFITDKEIIGELLDSKKSKNEIEAIELLFKKCGEDESQFKEPEKSAEIENPITKDDFLEGSILINDQILGDENIEFSESDLIEQEDKINSMLKNKLTAITIEKYLKSKGLQPIDFEMFSREENSDSFELHVISKIKEDLENDSESIIKHDEIAILAGKKEKLIDKYFEIKENILDINSLIEYKIKKDKIEFYHDSHFLTISIEKDHVLIAIKTNDQLNLNDKLMFTEHNENSSKNIHQYDIIVKADENIDNLIELVEEVLD
jgi:hypothetical protein